MYTNSNQMQLILNHIISTFDVKFGMLWIAGTGSYISNTKNRFRTFLNTDASLISFLAGYYYRFKRGDKKRYPTIIENIFDTPRLPENIINLSKIENISSILISPVMKNNYIKGTLILGSSNVNILNNINHDLLRLLTDAALYLNNHNNNSYPNYENAQEINSFGLITGKSKQMQEIYKAILKISRSDANVFIYGESGTGKELIARTIHSHSHRKHQVFIPVDCVALPRSLLESELFGFEKGAFTGANSIKKGLIEYANNGTFFLDEITELPFDLQAKLLRFLQERQFRRLGGKQLIDVDIRIISATNCDPHAAIAEKSLREDLFFRLNVIPIYVPPLCERKEDIPLLAKHFIKEISQSNEVDPFEISAEAMDKLMNYKWSGNVRELRNIMERVIALTKNEVIDIDDLPEEIINFKSTSNEIENSIPITLTYNQAKQQNLVSFEQSYFTRLLDKYNGNISKVAKEAQVSRKTIYNIFKKHSLNSYQNLSVVNYES